MSIFQDVSRFLEERLDSFLAENPHLELQAIADQLAQQERESQQLVKTLQEKEQAIQQQIMDVAQDIQRWHQRAAKATQAHRPDLAQGAKEREAVLLAQGNQLWGKMEAHKQTRRQTEKLLAQVKQKRQEVNKKLAELPKQAPQDSGSTATAWNTWGAGGYGGADPLESQFQKWELDEELAQMKKKMQ